MSYRKVTNTLLEVARRYQKDMDIARKCVKEQNLPARMGEDGLNIDYRDFLPMITLMGIQGKTEEERTADIRKKLEALAAAFEDPDTEKRDDYLDLIYYLLDDYGSTFDPVAMNMTDPAQVEKLLQSMMLAQTIGVKKNENPEYYNKRYRTPEERTIADARLNYSMSVGDTVSSNLFHNGIVIDCILSLPEVIPQEALEIHHLQETYARGVMEQAIASKGKPTKTDTIDFPVLDSMISCCGKNVADIRKFSPEDYDLVKNYYSYVVEGTLLRSGSKNTEGLKEADLGDVKNAVYIDGKTFLDFEKEHYPKGTANALQDVIVGTCMLGGKHKVDIVSAYRDENGVMQYEVKTVRPAITPEQEQLYMQQFSWFRRAFLNRGPFRIEPLQDLLDRIANDPDADARHAGVRENLKEKIEGAMAKKAELTSEGEMQKKQTEARRAAYAEAVTYLEGSASQWDKDSVIGILGQQIVGEHKVNETNVTGICAAMRKTISAGEKSEWYGEMAPMFAKVVLYAQLCHEREVNNGEPGELEKLLSTDNTIRQNIESTAQRLAKDIVFKNVVLKKIGKDFDDILAPDRYKLEGLIAAYGCRGIWMEYKQKLKDLDDQAEQDDSSNGVKKENKKLHKKSKAMMK